MSRLYLFILNMWVMGKNKEYVEKAYDLNYITQEEKDRILATLQHRG